MPTDVDFYADYSRFKNYATPVLKAKHVARFDREFWDPAACTPDMTILELGCGTGQFLDYLRIKGVAEFVGVDFDENLTAHLPPGVAAHFRAADIVAYLEAGAEGRSFDRIALFDVLEHFTAAAGVHLLSLCAGRLRPGGRIVVRVPNMASPWGAQFQYGDLTHRTAYVPSSLRQAALAAGCVCTACYRQQLGSPVRRVLDPVFHAVLSRLLMTPPELWSANFLAILEVRD